MRSGVLAAGWLLALTGAAFAGTAVGNKNGLGNKNVNLDPHTAFPSGTGSGVGSDGSLAVQMGGRLSRSAMTGHPATAYIGSGWGGSTVPPDGGRVGGTSSRR